MDHERTERLTCHPQTCTDTVRGIGVRVQCRADGRLAVAFTLDADLARLRIPRPQPARRVEGLWAHTCFELFVALADAPAYHEFNFSPSSEWAVYAFRGYRDPEPHTNSLPPPEISVLRLADRIELQAIVHLDAAARHAPLRLALSAVIEDECGALSYWALRHPASKPDFHHPDSFVLCLESPGVDSVPDPS